MNGLVKSKRKRTGRAALVLSAALAVGGFTAAPADARPTGGTPIGGELVPPKPTEVLAGSFEYTDVCSTWTGLFVWPGDRVVTSVDWPYRTDPWVIQQYGFFYPSTNPEFYVEASRLVTSNGITRQSGEIQIRANGGGAEYSYCGSQFGDYRLALFTARIEVYRIQVRGG